MPNQLSTKVILTTLAGGGAVVGSGGLVASVTGGASVVALPQAVKTVPAVATPISFSMSRREKCFMVNSPHENN
jgi:hypothetical protein